MKFAIPTHEKKLCLHFGHCEAFAIIDTDEGNSIISEQFLNPPAHEPGVFPKWLSEMGVHVVIAGGMGMRAINLFSQNGIKVVTGAQPGSPKSIVEQYLSGTLQTGANACDH